MRYIIAVVASDRAAAESSTGFSFTAPYNVDGNGEDATHFVTGVTSDERDGIVASLAADGVDYNEQELSETHTTRTTQLEAFQSFLGAKPGWGIYN